MKVSINWLKEFTDISASPPELKRTLTDVGLGVESAAPLGDDTILEVEVTTNRPDCLNHYGIAREFATAYRHPLKKVEVVLKEYGIPATERISIEILDAGLCARYCGRVLRNVQVKPSPDWLVKRLAAIGARSINNITDATNYVLLELGHPLHAFDLEQIRQYKVLVRRARAGEHLKTLDGVERQLKTENLVIADGERAIALAGIMGGEESAIHDWTTSVLLESAWFDPVSIRRTAKAQGMHTEASHRFERGADIEIAPLALDRATELILELAGGELLRGRIDVYPYPRRREKIDFRRTEIHRVLGAEILWEEVERILRSLGFLLERRGTEGWRVTPPSFRLDATREVDLIEEVARHWGYDKLPSRLVPAPPRTEYDPGRQKETVLAQTLVGLGYREIKTSPMVDPVENAAFSDKPSVMLQNPLSMEASALRTTSMPSMLAAMRRNLDRDQEELHFFEMGKAYWRSGSGPEEHRVLTIGLSGHRRPQTVHDNPRDADFFDLKGDLETVFQLFTIDRLRFRSFDDPPECAGTPRADSTVLPRPNFENPRPLGGQGPRPALSPAGAGRVRRLPENPVIKNYAGHDRNTERYFDTIGATYFATGLSGEFLRDESRIAALGRLNESLTSEYKLRRPVWLAEIDLDRLLDFPLRPKTFHPFSKFPAVQRDFSLLVPDSVNFAQISEAIERIAAAETLQFTPVDLFRGASIEQGHYGLLLRLTLQSRDHTLTGEEITAATDRVLESLAPLGIHLRA
jgi:phenylalanyl-tRNA synthetase beta chain